MKKFLQFYLLIKKKKEITVKNEIAFLTENFINYNYKTKESRHTDKFISSFVEIYLKEKKVRVAEYTIDHEFKNLNVIVLDYNSSNPSPFSYDLSCNLN